ncbi:NADH-quinone oxidoreductase subunit C [Brevibacillus aydinogluensis]|uniref:NADH-quinone oxidoreductase subunit C n=1 Tax=Brevibacillus aydinogluensis TaxID=927786 RepID=A0AA48M468_9BACL|nr:NADH-quinone oxidoreductase subunit C [Brevibacillus aydinogluensis]CAJ1000940.1 NADH-quinone oxidoreductase subunit C [Brevibacillus aydinogluensis]
MSDEKRKPTPEEKAKAAAEARAKAEALRKAKEQQAKGTEQSAASPSNAQAAGGDTSEVQPTAAKPVSEMTPEEKAKAKAAAAAAAAAKAKAAREAAEAGGAESGGDADAKAKAAAAAKAKAAAAAAAAAKAKAAREAAEAGGAESGGDADAKAKAAAAAKAKAGGAAGADEAAEAPKQPSPNQPYLDKYVTRISEAFGADVLEAAYINELSKDVPTLVVKNERWHDVARFLKEDEALAFDYLSDLHGVDYEDRMEVYYHFYSYKNRQSLAVKVKTNREQPSVSSVMDIWRGADWCERETFDLLGIYFPGHTELRRILLPDEWIGYPLRKDYVQYDEEV